MYKPEPCIRCFLYNFLPTNKPFFFLFPSFFLFSVFRGCGFIFFYSTYFLRMLKIETAKKILFYHLLLTCARRTKSVAPAFIQTAPRRLEVRLLQKKMFRWQHQTTSSPQFQYVFEVKGLMVTAKLQITGFSDFQNHFTYLASAYTRWVFGDVQDRTQDPSVWRSALGLLSYHGRSFIN